MARSESPKPLSVKALEAQFGSLDKALNHETPLACVLIATSFIEQCLSTILRALTIQPSGTADTLCDYAKGTLRDMRSRATLAYCLGLIDKGMFNNLIAIGDIRNRFAHSPFEIDFTDKNVIDHCNELVLLWPSTFVSTAPDRTIEDVFSDIGNKAQGRFIAVTGLMAVDLMRIAGATRHLESPNERWTVTVPKLNSQ